MVPANFNQLYYYWIVARAGSISAAAKRLLLTQSTLSVQIKQLELAIGKTLLLRDRRGAHPTEEGRLCADYCERIFSQAEEMLAVVRDGKPPEPTLRLGVLQSVSRGKILALTAFARGVCPEIAVNVRSFALADLRAGLQRRTLDMALSDLDLSSQLGGDFRSRLLGRVPHYFIGVPRVKRLMGTFPRGLARVPLLLRTSENPVRKALDQFLELRGISVSVRAEIDDPDLLRVMALSGEGACLMDAAPIRGNLAAGRLVKLSPRAVVHEPYWLLSSRHAPPHESVHRAVAALMSRFTLEPVR